MKWSVVFRPVLGGQVTRLSNVIHAANKVLWARDGMDPGGFVDNFICLQSRATITDCSDKHDQPRIPAPSPGAISLTSFADVVERQQLCCNDIDRDTGMAHAHEAWSREKKSKAGHRQYAILESTVRQENGRLTETKSLVGIHSPKVKRRIRASVFAGALINLLN